MIEIEAKMKVADHPALRERLKSAGATRVTTTLETNTFFDTPDRALFKADKGLRLRQERDESGRDKIVVTYKGPRLHGPLKSREEIEFPVGDAPAAMRVFELLGFARLLLFEKRRETWTLAECQIALDELPRLGSFVEIEGPTEAAILWVREAIGLVEQPMLRDTYVALLVDYLARHGERKTEIRF